MVPIRYLFLEGVDCSGKSTLYSSVHKSTGFGYNIIDRSRLSRLCYARFYGRAAEVEERDALLEEVCDANNFFVILVPPIDVIMSRYRSRGDEIQDESSLRKLHEIFLEESEKLACLPNVLIVRDEKRVEDLTSEVIQEVNHYRSQSFDQIGKHLVSWAKLTQNSEVQVILRLDVKSSHSDVDIMHHPKESDYYYGILKDTLNKIHDEYEGKNPYGLRQDATSRRFYYASDSCISSIHFLPRGENLKVLATLRSTDAQRNGSPDVRFLAHLSSRIAREFSWNPSRIRLEVRYNSLHVRKDLV